MQITPITDCPGLKLAILLLSAIWLLLGVRLLVVFGTGAWPLLSCLALMALVLGLWRLHPLARSLSKLLLGSLIVLDILATFGPLYGLDHPAARYGMDIPWSDVLIRQIPLLGLGLLLFWLLDRCQHRFTSGQSTRQSDET